MSRFMLLLAVLSWSGIGYSSNHTGAVKIRSYPCGDLSQMQQGSGSVIDEAPVGKSILTVGHVIYHGYKKDRVCTEILAPNGQWMEAELSHVHAGYDLATLEPTADFWKQPVKVLKFAETDEATALGRDVMLLGFYSLNDSPVQEKGKILLTDDKGMTLPLVHKAISVKDVHSHHAMSGGGLVDLTSGTFLGVAAQQRQVQAGEPSIAEFPASETPKDDKNKYVLIPLITPLKTIRAWFAEIEKGTGNLLLDLDYQRKNLVSLTVGPIRFSEVACEDVAKLNTQGKNVGGQGIGIGGQGIGIGGQGIGIGGQGIGIGGRKPISVCRIDIERISADESRTQAWPLASTAVDEAGFNTIASGTIKISQRTSEWFDKRKNKLVIGKPRWFTHMQLREQKIQVRGLMHALTLMREGFFPKINPDDPSGSKQSAEMIATIHQLKMTIAEFERSIDLEEMREETKQLLTYLKSFYESADSGNGDIIDTAYTRLILSAKPDAPYAKGWTQLDKKNFDRSVSLSEYVHWLCDYIEGMR